MTGASKNSKHSSAISEEISEPIHHQSLYLHEELLLYRFFN